MVGLFKPSKHYITGKKKSKKQYKREVLEYIKAKGRDAEETAKLNSRARGYEVEGTGRGSDFRERKRDLLTGRITRSRLVEVKSGKAKLSKLQQKTKKRKSNYRVERVDSPFW